MVKQELRRTEHWRVSSVDDPERELHVVFTLLAFDAGRPPRVRLLDDEQANLNAALQWEVDRRGLISYEVVTRVSPGGGVQAHLLAGNRCPGLTVSGAAAEVQILFDLAGAVMCPLCGSSVQRWRVERGRLGHEPGE